MRTSTLGLSFGGILGNRDILHWTVNCLAVVVELEVAYVRHLRVRKCIAGVWGIGAETSLAGVEDVDVGKSLVDI